jgi:hypothetical protein
MTKREMGVMDVRISRIFTDWYGFFQKKSVPIRENP